MALTKSQARKIAQQIYTRFGARIAAACAGTPVPPEFVAGLISNEAGKDRAGNIVPTATRFEPGVFRKLKQVQDGLRKSWSGIRQRDIKDAPDPALRALATSYSLTQIMGWHCIHNLDCTIAQLRDPNLHLVYAVKLLMMNAASGDFERREFAGEFREWNTGSEGGKTYHADYVANGAAVMAEYAEFPQIPAEPVVTPAASIDSGAIVGSVPDSGQAPPAVNIEHADQVSTETTTPVPGGQKDDPPIQASQGGNKTVAATSIGGAIGVATAIFGWIQNNGSLVTMGVICATVVILALIFRQFILDFLRMRYISDPNRINVK
jgi:hypothetical protein